MSAQKKGHLLFSWPTLFLSFFVLSANAQRPNSDSVFQQATLTNIIQYAIKHQPVIRQSQIDEQITETTIRNKLADWYPQVNFNYSLQHNFQVPTNIIGGNPVKLGVDNVSAGQFTVRQNIFNPDVLLAKRSAGDVRLQSRQTTENNKISIVVNVAKAFYSVLASMQQINVSAENIVRLERSLKDAKNQYQAGVADKIDYKRTTITLNNTVAQKRGNEENLKARIEYLKSLMNFPDSSELNIVYDSLQMEREIALDTLQPVNYKTRIEYQQLETQRRLLKANVDYNKWSYLPTLSANGAYNLNYQSDPFMKLYNNNFPSSFAALTLGFPIFQGGKRQANVRQAELRLIRNDWDITALKNSVNSEYENALAAYKSNLAVFQAQKENVDLAQEVYDVVQLQYRSGIKAYLEVITSETDLRTARINFINAQYNLLASKIDVQKALGQITY